MTTKANKSLTTNNIKKAVNWLAGQAGVSVSHKSSLKAKLKVIANSKRVHDYTPSYSGSVKEILKNLAKHIGSTGSIYADKIIAAAKAHPSESAGGISYCLRWVVNVLIRAGLNGSKINADSATNSWYKVRSKAHFDFKIPTGAIVYGEGAGTSLGHIGICIQGYEQGKIIIRDDYYDSDTGRHGPTDHTLAAWTGTYPWRGYVLYEEL